MRIPKRLWYVFGAALVLVVVWLVWPPRPANEAKLADGSLLRLEKVSYGRREPFQAGGWYGRAKQQLSAHLPKSWAARIAPGGTNKTSWSSSFSTLHTNMPALQVWISRRDAATRAYQNVQVRYAELVDEDGCAFGATAGGGEDDGLLPPPPPAAPVTVTRTTGTAGFSGGFITQQLRSSVNWFTFEVFPRGDSQLKLRFYDEQRRLVAEFAVSNPAPLPGLLTATTLPVSVTNGEVVFRLVGASVHTNVPQQSQGLFTALSGPVTEIAGSGIMMSDNRYAQFTFQTMEQGMSSGDWYPLFMELKDGLGNLAPVRISAPLPLCPGEPVWKLTVKFARSEEPMAASNRTWSLRGVSLPAPGKAMSIGTNFQLGDLSIQLIGMGGAGMFTYSNGVAVEATPIGGGTRGSSAVGRNSRGTTANFQTLRGTVPHVALISGELGEDQYLAVAVVDDRGRRTYARMGGGAGLVTVVPYRGGTGIDQMRYLGRGPRRGGGGWITAVNFLFLDVSPEARILDLTFQLHDSRTVEFVFRPETELFKR